MVRDYSADVRRLYSRCSLHPRQLTERDAIAAGAVAERLFPPADAHATACVLVALNLLNAFVKQPGGRLLVSYGYIKGMAARVMYEVLRRNIDGVSVYWDADEQIGYFRVEGVQISFHYIQLFPELVDLMASSRLQPQQWEGMQLQRIAYELFALFCPDSEHVSDEEEQQLTDLMANYRQPEAPGHHATSWQLNAMPIFFEDKRYSLQMALRFSIWGSDMFMLWRRRDERPMPVVRYTGNNYSLMVNRLIRPGERIWRRPAYTLQVGQLYYVTPKKRLRALAPSRYILSMTQNGYLLTSHGYCNLCITYGMARFLTVLYPRLKFVCTLDYNRLLDQHQYYSLNDLYMVPLTSDTRWLKVWMAIDTGGLLEDFDPFESMPSWLIDDYMQAEDHYDDYQVFTAKDGRKGLMAYRRLVLLEPVYADIRVHSFHAHVKGDNGLWAIYALLEEHFRSDFVYSRIWYDVRRGAIMGRVDDHDECIYQFNFGR